MHSVTRVRAYFGLYDSVDLNGWKAFQENFMRLLKSLPCNASLLPSLLTGNVSGSIYTSYRLPLSLLSIEFLVVSRSTVSVSLGLEQNLGITLHTGINSALTSTNVLVDEF